MERRSVTYHIVSENKFIKSFTTLIQAGFAVRKYVAETGKVAHLVMHIAIVTKGGKAKDGTPLVNVTWFEEERQEKVAMYH